MARKPKKRLHVRGVPGIFPEYSIKKQNITVCYES